MEALGYLPARYTLFFMLYGGAAVAAVIICLYLLLRRGNAFVADVTPPVRLRRWAAAFFAAAALSHILWFLLYVYSWDAHSVSYLMVCLFDCMTLLTTIFGTLLSMLQDRKRPLWPFATAMIPIVILGLLQIALPGVDFMHPGLIYTLAVYALFTLYMTIAVKQYGRWLRDNYADLERKEVWQSHTLLFALLLLFVSDEFVFESTFMVYLVRVIDFVLFGLLLWRVETLPQLEVASMHEYQSASEPAQESDFQSATDSVQEADHQSATAPAQEAGFQVQKTKTNPSDIGQLLAEYCEGTQLYLQHDLTLAQLAAAIGINRTYLSQHFSSLGMNYNAYINGLRINHFVGLYREAVATRHPFTLQQLAGESGYRSYSTFSLAFKQRMGQSVTAWMRSTVKK